MEKLKAWIESHPYLSSSIVAVVIVGLYLYFHTGTSAQQQQSDSSATNQYDVELAQLQAAQQQAQEQNATALSIAGLQANTAVQQINAGLAATENTNSTQLQGLENTNATQVQLVNTETAAKTTQQSQLESLYQNIYDAVINAGVSENDSNNQLAELSINSHNQLINAAINSAPVGSGRYGGVQNLIEAINNEQGPLEANAASAALQSQASALEVSQIIGSISGGIL
jgi:hypothetical protein